jgi:hypothetical protein
MATEGLSMTKTREILRKKWVLKLSYREIGLSVGAAPSGVWHAIKRAEAAGLDWAAVEKLDNGELDARLYRRNRAWGACGRWRTARGSTPSGAASASRWNSCTWRGAGRLRPTVCMCH